MKRNSITSILLALFLIIITNICDAEIDYKVLNEEVHDVPLKTQVKLEIELSGDFTESELRIFLEKLYQNVLQRSEFKHHKHPTNIYIFAHISSKTHMDYYIVGTVRKSFSDTYPEIWINKQYIPSSLIVPTDERLGLSGPKRVEIWNEFWKRDDALSVEAEKKFPRTVRGIDWWKNATKVEKDEFGKFIKDGEKKYKMELIKKYKITQKQLDEIILEGFEKEWPYPVIEKTNSK